jgi:hypothetical protein
LAQGLRLEAGSFPPIKQPPRTSSHHITSASTSIISILQVTTQLDNAQVYCFKCRTTVCCHEKANDPSNETARTFAHVFQHRCGGSLRGSMKYSMEYWFMQTAELSFDMIVKHFWNTLMDCVLASPARFSRPINQVDKRSIAISKPTTRTGIQGCYRPIHPSAAPSNSSP